MHRQGIRQLPLRKDEKHSNMDRHDDSKYENISLGIRRIPRINRKKLRIRKEEKKKGNGHHPPSR